MPFVEGKAIHPYDPSSVQEPVSTKVDAAAQLSHRTDALIEGGIDAQTSFKGHQDYLDHFGSLTDTEDFIQRKALKVIEKREKSKMLKTSLYEIREEGYVSNGSAPSNAENFKNFSSKRFNRYPRFTIFLKKNAEGAPINKYAVENTISLNPLFLSYL